MIDSLPIQILELNLYGRDKDGKLHELKGELAPGEECLLLVKIKNTGKEALRLEGLDLSGLKSLGLIATDGASFISGKPSNAKPQEEGLPLKKVLEAGEEALCPIALLADKALSLEPKKIVDLIKPYLGEKKDQGQEGKGEKEEAKPNEETKPTEEAAASMKALMDRLQAMLKSAEGAKEEKEQMPSKEAMEGLLAGGNSGSKLGQVNPKDLAGLLGQGAATGAGMTNMPSFEGMGGGSVTVKNKPKLIISSYEIRPEMPKAGEEFILNLDFHNTNKAKAIRNIKITMNAEAAGEGDSSLSGMLAQRTGDAAPQSGSVFIPVKASNSFYIEKMAAGQVASQTVRLKVIPSAPAQNYSLNLVFEYEDMDGNQYSAQEVVGIPVVQKAQVLLGDVVLGRAAAGEPMMVDLDFYNTGKDNLTNFMVNLEGTGFTSKDNTRYFVGNFPSGQSEHYSMEIHPDNVDKLSGNIILTYEDSAGESHEEKVPFESEVETLKEGESLTATGEIVKAEDEPKSGSGGFPIISLIILLALAGLLFYFFRRRSNKKKASAEELKIHED